MKALLTTEKNARELSRRPSGSFIHLIDLEMGGEQPTHDPNLKTHRQGCPKSNMILCIMLNMPLYLQRDVWVLGGGYAQDEERVHPARHG